MNGREKALKRGKRKGLIEVYTGNGKGKTTAALGLAVRAIGHGLKVYMIQFMKGGIKYGELETAKKMDNFEIKSFGRPEFVKKGEPEEIDVKLAKKALKHAEEVVRSGKYDVVILDEVNVAVEWGLIKLKDLIKVIKGKPGHVELVLTGRYAPKKVVEEADLVTEMKSIKHPLEKGIIDREGVDY